MTTRTSALLVTLVAACGGGTAGDDGGNVGFGGAQDIGQFRSILDQGEIPGEETLDANGFFAEHYSALPPATCGQVLCLDPMLSVGHDWLDGGYQATLQIAMTTPVDPATLQRLPLNLVVVVDHSGSMSADGRMDKVKAGLHILIDSLEPGDQMGLIQFDNTIDTLATLGTAFDPASLHARVDQMYPRGSTNIYDGLRTGLLQSAAYWSPERQNRIILLSDGLATAGNTNPTAIIAMADGFVDEGMSLTTIGVGLDFDVLLMRGLAEHGAGNFYFLEDAQAVDEVFTDELDYSLSTLALDVHVNAVPGARYRIGAVTGTRVWSSTSDGGEAVIPAVFIASRVSQPGTGGRRGGGGSIFIDLEPLAGAIDSDLADLTLTYRLPGSGETITQRVTVANPYAPGEAPEDTYVSIQAMMEHYAAYNMYLGLHEAAHTAAYRYDCALAALDSVRGYATRWNDFYNDPDITADLLLLEQFAANLRAKGAYYPEGQPPTRAECTFGPGDVPPDYYPPDDYGPMVCSAGGSSTSGGLTLILIAGALVISRRRRR